MMHLTLNLTKKTNRSVIILIIQEKYDQATAFIHSQLKRLTTIDYNLLVSIYIEYLENLSPVIRQKHHFDNRQLASLRKKLSEFS